MVRLRPGGLIPVKQNRQIVRFEVSNSVHARDINSSLGIVLFPHNDMCMLIAEFSHRGSLANGAPQAGAHGELLSRHVVASKIRCQCPDVLGLLCLRGMQDQLSARR